MLTRALYDITFAKLKIIWMNILTEFGQRIQAIRRQKGLSQEKLAEMSGLHRTYIGMIERAEKNITLKNIEKIAIALNVSIKDLFE